MWETNAALFTITPGSALALLQTVEAV